MPKLSPPVETADDTVPLPIALSPPTAEARPAHGRGALIKRRRGRPSESTKEVITIRIDKDTLARFRATGRGWQTRMNDALRRARL